MKFIDAKKRLELIEHPEQLRHIYVEVANGRGNHGGFLRALADTVARADETNLQILAPALSFFALHYDLVEYLCPHWTEGD